MSHRPTKVKSVKKKMFFSERKNYQRQVIYGRVILAKHTLLHFPFVTHKLFTAVSFLQTPRQIILGTKVYTIRFTNVKF